MRMIIVPAAFFALTLSAENVFSVPPYVQHPTADGMTVLFFTTKPCEATVKCWPADDGPLGITGPTGSGSSNSVGDVIPNVPQTEQATCEEATDVNATWATDDKPVWGTQYRHRARFEKKLAGGTRYCYAVEPVGYAAYTNFFSTVPDRNTPVRFVAYSDSECVPPDYKDTTWGKNNHATDDGRTKEWHRKGIGDSEIYWVSRSEGYATNLAHMAAWQPDLFVIAGDLVARGGVQMFWDEFWKENAGANAKGYADWAGSIPILAVPGNHDNYDNNGKLAVDYGIDSKMQGDCGITKYLSYFEFNPNGVDYANASGAHSDERYSKDRSQMFHREDYGPVTLIFVDTNNEKDSVGNDTNTGLSNDKTTGISKEARAPNFKPGTLQYEWLTNSLADAQAKSRFTFVVNHHCPYSRGSHSKAGNDQCGLVVRNHLSDAMVRYGVTGWLCGHEEMVEHATLTGERTLPDGTKAPHTVHVFDLGSGGDGLKGSPKVTCENVDFRAYDTADGTHYGHLRVEVRRNAATRKWECAMSQVYSFIGSATGPFELRKYNEYVVESAAQDEPEHWTEEPVWTTATRTTHVGGEVTERQYRGFLTKKGREYAWGEDGEAATEWRKGDGTPMELKQPKGDGWELMVR